MCLVYRARDSSCFAVVYAVSELLILLLDSRLGIYTHIMILLLSIVKREYIHLSIYLPYTRLF